MKTRAWAVAVFLWLSTGPTFGPGAAAQTPGPPRSVARTPPAPPDVDLLAIRNVFRYGDEPGPGPASLPRPRAAQPVQEDPTEAPPVSRARLVGFVERSGRLVAAVSLDGEVMLLDEGQSVRGFTVVDIEDETLRLRDPDGNVESLRLP